MAFLYPELPNYKHIRKENKEQVYYELASWSSQLKFLLEARDTEVDAKSTSKVLTVVTVASIGRPSNGDVSFSTSSSKFRGYIEGTGWVDFN